MITNIMLLMLIIFIASDIVVKIIYIKEIKKSTDGYNKMIEGYKESQIEYDRISQSKE